MNKKLSLKKKKEAVIEKYNGNTRTYNGKYSLFGESKMINDF
jgi:hypothetical protein